VVKRAAPPFWSAGDLSAVSRRTAYVASTELPTYSYSCTNAFSSREDAAYARNISLVRFTG